MFDTIATSGIIMTGQISSGHARSVFRNQNVLLAWVLFVTCMHKYIQIATALLVSEGFLGRNVELESGLYIISHSLKPGVEVFAIRAE